METASQDLVNEHKAILIALDVIEKIYKNLQNDKEIDIKDIENILEFLKVFADKCHHGKEEEYLFPALEEVGVKNQNGPIGVMLAEHKQGRELIRQMQESTEDKIFNKQLFVNAASAYVNLLKKHIDKENAILFPMGDANLSASKQQELLDNFENLEKNVIGEGKHEELHNLLERFEKKYLA